MFFAWLKNYMPRSLYGRAALILISPVVTLQLVVSVVFIQRHFEGVTEQMSRGVALELRYLLDEMQGLPTQAGALNAVRDATESLNYDFSYVSDAQLPAQDLRRWYDFSGIVVVRSLNENLQELRRVEMPDDRHIFVYTDTKLGLLKIGFDRPRVSATNPHQLLVNMLFFGVLMTVISFFYLRNQLRPITRLGHVAEAFGRGQTLPYHASGAVEVRAAGNAFLAMRARIERQIEQRTMMLSGVSHDLRTPLTRLKLGLSMLEDEDREPLERDVEDMRRLLDEFLNFASGSAEGEQELSDPARLTQLAIEDAVRMEMAVKMLKVEAGPHVMLNPLSMRRALDNLIGNAVRYGTLAQVSVLRTEKTVTFRVEDDGPGLAEDLYGAAVKPFVRLDPARNQDKGTGVGLGLAITNDIARAHGGSLRFSKSDTLGGLRADIVIRA
ncbi:MAG: ATP-binding protein [Planktotalea sp.]|jgi:two-component system osmolarity sensor histidine kinase EnvZ|uniref:ATP-binding protein n=1 Tax=Planktotalea sp. TaxID=2029877 RepID=UPI000183BBFF|nr:ATP-binding protein [Planktotalea sp.]EDZ43897.1 sensor histidine kinase [Rhodobacteraceae bacterium HTCC2083]MDG1077118.1 ATP-binding protein [Planktotalea sp.]MDG1085807.1 ATP-binding protein [Planktotalea sp.]HCW86036.1 HAMP domain-containing protein [Paracoccaceae bacterium]